MKDVLITGGAGGLGLIFAKEIAHTKARVTCTRKTIPGLRAFEKHAVRLGGGSVHRYGLDDAILIKDNHIAVCGGVKEAIRAGKAYAGHLVRVECEVTSLELNPLKYEREALTSYVFRVAHRGAH